MQQGCKSSKFDIVHLNHMRCNYYSPIPIHADVARAKDDNDRLIRLNVASKAFDHRDRETHDDDVKAGAVTILCNTLRAC